MKLKRLHQFIFSQLRIVTHADLARSNAEIERRNAALEKRLDALEQRLALLQLAQEGAKFAIRRVYKRINDLSSGGGGKPYLANFLAFEQQLDALKKMEPNAFNVWWQCFLNGERAYKETSEANLSSGSHPVAQAFRDFISPYLAGNVLDVGCGPQLLPTYINFDANKSGVRLYGIDPLSSIHPFEFYHGFAEFLPWQDDCFDALIVATSLDHCLSLDRTLSEIHRVLKSDGFLLIWVGFVPGAQEYHPKSQNVAAIDEYHLFHFDRPWFEAVFKGRFSIISRCDFDAVSSFYVFVK